MTYYGVVPLPGPELDSLRPHKVKPKDAEERSLLTWAYFAGTFLFITFAAVTTFRCPAMMNAMRNCNYGLTMSTSFTLIIGTAVWFVFCLRFCLQFWRGNKCSVSWCCKSQGNSIWAWLRNQKTIGLGRILRSSRFYYGSLLGKISRKRFLQKLLSTSIKDSLCVVWCLLGVVDNCCHLCPRR